MNDKPLALAQLIVAITAMAEQEFEHVWNLIHAVKQEGVPAALLRNATTLPEIPKL